MESGPKYAISKEGLIKFLVLLFGCTAFALYTASGLYTAPAQKTWAFAVRSSLRLRRFPQQSASVHQKVLGPWGLRFGNH